jgi:hypothetical protein
MTDEERISMLESHVFGEGQSSNHIPLLERLNKLERTLDIEAPKLTRLFELRE